MIMETKPTEIAMCRHSHSNTPDHKGSIVRLDAKSAAFRDFCDREQQNSGETQYTFAITRKGGGPESLQVSEENVHEASQKVRQFYKQYVSRLVRNRPV